MNRDDIRIREFTGLRLEFSAPTEVELREGEDGAEDHLYGRIVPYNTPTQIGRDVFEKFAPGSLDKTLREYSKGVKLYSTHDTRSRQPIGSVKNYDSREDGMYVRFSLNRTNDANDVRELVRTGDATGLSVGFVPVRQIDSPPDAEGRVTVTRTEAALDHVAFVARPAYPDAQVASVREDPKPLTEVLSTPKLDFWKEKLGIE